MADTNKQMPETARETRQGEAARIRPVTDAAREATEAGAEAASSARVMVDVARRAMEQGQAAVQLGIGTMAGVQAPMAESGYQQGRRMVETTARMTEAYREAAERTTEDLQALIASYAQIARGMQQWQHAWFDTTQRMLDRLGQKPQALFNCHSPVEMAQIQRDIYLEVMNSMVNSGTTLLQLTAQIAQDATRPLQGRGQRPV